MSDSFQIFRGSWMRLSRRRVCSSALTSSQYLSSRIPESTMAFSTRRHQLEEPFGLLRRAEAHDPLDAGPVVPTAVEDHDLAGRREVRDVALEVHLRLLPLGRGGQGHDPEHPRADPFGDPLDRAALAGGVPALEHDADLGPGRLDPLLHGDQLAVQDAASRARTPCASSSAAGHSRLGAGRCTVGGAWIVARAWLLLASSWPSAHLRLMRDLGPAAACGTCGHACGRSALRSGSVAARSTCRAPSRGAARRRRAGPAPTGRRSAGAVPSRRCRKSA